MTKEESLQVKVESPVSEGSFTKVNEDIQQAVESSDRLGFMKELYAEMKSKDPRATCPSCGGAPLGKKVCEVCGAGKTLKKIDYFRLENEGILERLRIPESFTRATYDKSILLKDKEHLKDNMSFVGFLDKLDRLMNLISKGGKLESSLFISAPSGFGKEHFVYTLMCLAVEKGLTVFPYIDLAQADRLIETYDQSHMSEYDKVNKHKNKDTNNDLIRDLIGFTDIEMYEADLCILKVPHANNGQSFKVALNIIDRRARRGKSTIIISRYHMKYFTMLDTFKEVDGIIDHNSVRPKNLKLIEFIK